MVGAKPSPSLKRDPSILAFAALGTWVGVWAASVPQIQHQAHLSNAQLGLAILLGTAFMIPVPLLLGPLARVIGARRVLPVALISFAVFGLLPVFATSLWTLALALGMTYIGAGLMDVSMNAAVAARESLEKRHLMQLAHSLFPLTFLISTLAVGILRSLDISLVLPFGVAGASLAAVGIMAVISPPSLGRIGEIKTVKVRRNWKPLINLCVIGFAAYAVEGSVDNWSAVHLEQTLRTGPFYGALAPTIIAAAAFAGRQISHRNSHRGQPQLMLAGVVVIVVGLVIAATASTPLVALAGFALSGLGFSPWAPAIFSQVGSLAQRTGDISSTAIVLAVSYAGLSAGPAFVGVVAGAAGLRFALASLLVFVALIVLLVGVPLRKRNRAQYTETVAAATAV